MNLDRKKQLYIKLERAKEGYKILLNNNREKKRVNTKTLFGAKGLRKTEVKYIFVTFRNTLTTV